MASKNRSGTWMKSKLTQSKPQVKTRFLNGAMIKSSLLFSDLIWQGYAHIEPNSTRKPVLVKAYNARN